MIRAALVTVVGLLVAACGGSAPTPSSSAPASPSASAGALTSPVEGVPIHIDTQGFSKITSFTVRQDDGTQVVFAMGTLENGDQFPPSHLAEHLAGGTRIRVFFRDVSGTPTAYRIEDAPPLGGASP